MQNMQKTVSGFLKYLGIPISSDYCQQLISSHADYPSLLSIVDVLDRFGIKHMVGKIEKNSLQTLPFPYLLQINSNGGELIEIRSKTDLTENKEQLKYWNGIVLQVDQPSAILDEENNRLYKRERFLKAIEICLVFAAVTLLIWPHLYNLSLPLVLLQLTSTAGILLGYLLVAKELGIKYDTVENFCGSGKNSDCDKVLNSEGAKLVGDIKLSDAVLSYFIFQSLFIALSTTIPSIGTGLLWPAAALSFVFIPIILYSLYYQYFVAKTWCKLCLLIDGILVIQMLAFGYLIGKSVLDITVISGEVLAVEGLTFIIIGASLLIVKNAIEKSNQFSKGLEEGARIKNNANVFNYLLRQQRKINTKLMDHEVTMGNPEAPVQIIMISNLYCKPCKDQHSVIGKMLNNFPDKINVALRFVVSKDKDSNHYLILYWLKFIHHKKDESALTLKLIHDWYTLMDLEKFKNKYPLGKEEHVEIAEDIEVRHLKWINHLSIAMTPTFFVNGYQLPKGYTLQDLFALIPSLAHEVKTSVHQMADSEILQHNEFVN